MANRTFTQFAYSFLKKKVNLYGRVTFGAAGAPTLDAPNSIGITGVSRTSAGLYVFTFADTYVRWVKFYATFKGAVFPTAPRYFTPSDTIGTSTKTFTVQFTDSAGVATDPANGSEVRVEFGFNDSNAY